MSVIIDDSEKSIEKSAQLLRSGSLVAFPTETVYGLGADLFNKNSIEKIYEAKQRPKTDPLIVHVSKKEQAKSLIKLNKFQQKCFDILADKFWPGPLTMVVPASDLVPKSVMAGGDFVGIRVPSHPIAQKFLSLCSIPVAAPSANLFGHVSPTTAKHVYDDLKSVDDIFIIQTEIDCEVGIESTVVKLEYENEISILRLGGIGSSEIKSEILNHEIFFKFNITRKFNEQLNDQNVSRETFLNESPGQNLTHYSPWIPTFIFDLEKKVCKKNNFQNVIVQRKMASLQNSVFIDFGKQHEDLKYNVLKYYDLSQKSDPKEAAFILYRFLREAEKIEGAKQILISNIPLDSSEHEALFDRVYRAASGKIIN